MGNKAKATKVTKTLVTKNPAFTPRKATFTVKGTGENRVFRAVNKRAHTVAKKAGHRLNVALSELAVLKDSGSYTYHVYDKNGALKPIKF